MSLKLWSCVAAAAIAVAAAAPAARAGGASAEDLRNAQANAAEWLMYGRDYRNNRFSPLTQLTPSNVAQLKPVFAYSTGGKFAGLEATPLFHDGTLYFTGDYARVFALDARTGTLRWYWEPKYEDGLEAVLCCGPINRGLAMLGDRVFVGTLDARLVALNTKDGSVAWEQKLEDWRKTYTATGAPLVVGDLVIAGTAGGEHGVRGFVQAPTIPGINWTPEAPLDLAGVDVQRQQRAAPLVVALAQVGVPGARVAGAPE